VLHQQNIHTPAKLTKWLGIETVVDPNDPNSTTVVANKKDPKCRFMFVHHFHFAISEVNLDRYLYGQHGRDKLKITRDSLAEIMTYHQVMPAYLDFMLVFGAQSDPKDLRFSGFREQVKLRTPFPGSSIPSLGRSGRHYQLCYNLKSAQFKKRSDENIKFDQWSIRQVAVYHQFDVENGTMLWIVTKGGEDLLDQYEQLIGSEGRAEDKQFQTPAMSLISSLSTHLLFCHWSTEDWRWYIRWQEEVLGHEVCQTTHSLVALLIVSIE
jgi:hypothetical protein